MFGCIIYILQALNTETCLNCLWWKAWRFVTKTLRATWTLSWNIQTKAIGNCENTHIYFNNLATIYTGLIWFQVTTNEMCTLKWLHPSFLKSQMQLVFMAVHSRYGPPLSERHSMQHWLMERMRVWRVYSAIPAAGHRWAGTHQQGWGSF